MTTFKSARFFFFFARHQVHDFLVAATQRGLRLVFGLAGGPLGLPFSLSVALAIADDLATAVDDAAAALAAAAAAAVASVTVSTAGAAVRTKAAVARQRLWSPLSLAGAAKYPTCLGDAHLLRNRRCQCLAFSLN